MKKWLIIFVTLLLIPVTLAEIECQLSTDNNTWTIVHDTRYGGDVNGELAHAQNLERCTDYIARCKNTTTDWGYASFQTDCDAFEEEEPMLSSVLAVIMMIIFFGFLGVISTGWALKIFSFGLAFIEAIFLLSLIYANSLSLDLTGLYQLNFQIMLILGFFLGFITMTIYAIRLINPLDSPEDQEESFVKFQSNKY